MPLRTYAPNSPFLVEDTTSTIAAVMGPTGVQRLYPLGFHSTAPLVATAPAATFTSLGWEQDGTNVRLASAGIHSLTAANSTTLGAYIYIAWSGGQATTGWYKLTDVATSTTKVTINLPYYGSTVTFNSTAPAVTFGADNRVAGQVLASPTYSAPMTVIKSAHGLAPGSAVRFTTDNAFPSPITAGTTYYVSRVIQHLTAGTASDRFTISTAPGGPEVYQTGTASNGTGNFFMFTSPTTVTWTSHGRSVGDIIWFSTDTTLPTGITASTNYYVVKVVDANSFQVATTAGGTPLTVSAAGSGTHSAILYYGSPTVTTATQALTLASITIPAGTLSLRGRVETNFLFQPISAAGNKVFALTYAGTDIYSATITTGTATVNLNKIVVPTGATQVSTTPVGMTGHGTSASSPITITSVNYSAADTTLAFTYTPTPADAPVTLHYYDVTVE